MKIKTRIAIMFALLTASAMLFGETYKAAVMDLPSSPTFKAVITAIVEATGNKVEIQVVPPARSAYMVVTKQADFSLPMLALKNSAKVKALDYDYSNAVLYKASFVLFTNKAKPIDLEELRKGNPKGYKVEVDVSQVDSWEFKGLPSTNIMASLKKVAEGTIDGFIHSQTSTDLALKGKAVDFKASNLKRQLYSEVDSIFPLLKGTRGGKVDQMLQDGIAKVKASGKFEEIFSLVRSDKYNDWQP
jgi:hypothetical protein